MRYLLFLIILLFLLGLERHQKTPHNKLRWIIPFVYVILVGFRGANVGVDTANYYQHYYVFGEDGFTLVERGFDFLNRLLYHLGFSHVPFFCICASFAIVSVAIAINNTLSRREYTLFMLLFCTIAFGSLCNGMRQNMACGLYFALALFVQYSTLSEKRKLLIYLIGILFGLLFHYSIIIIAPFYLLRYLKMSNKFYMSLFLLSFLFVFFNISDFLASKIPVLAVSSKDYASYLVGDLAHQNASSLGFIVSSIRNILILLLMFQLRLFKKYPLISNMVFMSFVLGNIGFSIPLMSRIVMYSDFFVIFIIAKIFSAGLNGLLQKAKPLVISLALIITILLVHGYRSEANKLLPYSFYWETPNYEKYIESESLL